MDGVFTGQILLFSFPWIPPNFMPCDGRLLPIKQYIELFTCLATKYGGDGETTFGLPNTSGMSVVDGFTYAICTNGTFPPRP